MVEIIYFLIIIIASGLGSISGMGGGIMNVGYEKAFLMQTSLNLPTSEIISTYVYKVGLVSGDYSYSTAVGLFNAVINVVLLVAVNQIVKRMNNGEGI